MNLLSFIDVYFLKHIKHINTGPIKKILVTLVVKTGFLDIIDIKKLLFICVSRYKWTFSESQHPDQNIQTWKPELFSVISRCGSILERRCLIS